MKLVMNISDQVSVLDYGEDQARVRPPKCRPIQRWIQAYLGTAEDNSSEAA